MNTDTSTDNERTPARNDTPSWKSPFKDQNLVNLLSFDANARVLFATDEWFATAENMLNDGPPIFVPNLYCKEGKVMDGWETRRKREAGHDWCIIKLSGEGGQVFGVEVDTAHFTGNQAPRISILATNCGGSDNETDESWFSWMPGAIRRLAQGGGKRGTGQSPETVAEADNACKMFQWKEILAPSNLGPGYEDTRMHYFIIPENIRTSAGDRVTHIRLNLFPDGGIARVRLWGYPSSPKIQNVDSISMTRDSPVSAQPYIYPEVSLNINGGIGLACSNKHYGIPANLIQSTYGIDMGDGWETARHPLRPPIIVKNPSTNLVDSPLMDWAILKLGMGGISGEDDGGVRRIIIDTKHFRGNYPESVQVEGCYVTDTTIADEIVCSSQPGSDENGVIWFILLPRSRLKADQEHVFERDSNQLENSSRAVSHVRVSIYPDGGLSRVRIYGKPYVLKKLPVCSK